MLFHQKKFALLKNVVVNLGSISCMFGCFIDDEADEGDDESPERAPKKKPKKKKKKKVVEEVEEEQEEVEDEVALQEEEDQGAGGDSLAAKFMMFPKRKSIFWYFVYMAF